MLRLTLDDSALTVFTERMSLQLKQHSERLMKLEEKQSLLDFESANFNLLSDRLASKLSRDMEERYKKDKLELLWDLKKQVDESFREKLKADVMKELNNSWQHRKEEIEQMVRLNNNSMEVLSDELRRAKFRLENLALSHEKKTSYLTEKLEELANPKPMSEKELQSDQLQLGQQSEVLQQRVSPAVVTVREIKFRDSNLDEVLSIMERKIQDQESINDRAYTGVIARITDLQKRLKEKEAQPVKVLVRQSSKDKLSLKVANDKLHERIGGIEEELKRMAQRQSNTVRNVKGLNERLRQLAEAREQKQRVNVKSYFDSSEQHALDERVRSYVDRMFTAPFEHRFASTLREQIDMKFLEIKHELMSYMKEIDKRLDSKSDSSRCKASIERLEEFMSEFKKCLAGKATEESLRKSVTYLEAKIFQHYRQTMHLRTEQQVPSRDTRYEKLLSARKPSTRTITMPRELSFHQ